MNADTRPVIRERQKLKKKLKQIEHLEQLQRELNELEHAKVMSKNELLSQLKELE